MPRLRDRSVLPPGGLRYYQSETNWFPAPHTSFEGTVAQIIAHRLANPWLVEKNGWSIEPSLVAAELDRCNGKDCQDMSWTESIVEGDPRDLGPTVAGISPQFSRIGRYERTIANGVSTIVEWEIAGGRVVPQDRANARAAVCVKCPKNVNGDLLSFFTKQAARLIALQLETKNNMKLATPLDAELGICDGCGCVNKLKVWCPKDIIDLKMKPEIKSQLDPGCWIFHEEPMLSNP